MLSGLNANNRIFALYVKHLELCSGRDGHSLHKGHSPSLTCRAALAA